MSTTLTKLEVFGPLSLHVCQVYARGHTNALYVYGESCFGVVDRGGGPVSDRVAWCTRVKCFIWVDVVLRLVWISVSGRGGRGGGDFAFSCLPCKRL